MVVIVTSGPVCPSLAREKSIWMSAVYFFFHSAKNGDPNFIFSLVDCCGSVSRMCPTVCDPMDYSAAHQASLSLTISQSLLKLMSIVWTFSNESDLCIKWSKYWNFSFSISLSNGDSGLIFFRIDGFALLAVQGTLFKSLIQHHTLKHQKY